MRLNSLKRCKSCLLPETNKTLKLNEESIYNICLAFHDKSGINWAIRLKELYEGFLNYKAKYNLPFNFVNVYLKEWQLKGLGELTQKKISRGKNE